MGLLQDVTFGLRLLVRNPLFALAAVVTLALGMGANSTVFTLVNGVFLRGLPFENPHEIVRLGMFDRTQGAGSGPVSYPDFLTFQSQSRSFRGLGASAGVSMDLSDRERVAERVTGASITANTFSLLGQRPVHGRDFRPEDERPGAEPVALLGYGLSQSRYGGDPAVLGRQVRINLRGHTVVGVMPPGEGFPNGAQAWVPLVPPDGPERRGQRTVQPFGRLASGVGVEQATVEVNTIARALAQDSPDTNENLDAAVSPFIQQAPQIVAVFTALQGAVGFVLLIACANVANLLLCRAVGRMRETSVRAALGAGRWRILRQLLVESVIVSLLGGLLGLGLAVLGVRTFWAYASDTGPPYWLNVAMDHRVFGFFLVVCVATAVLFGLAPALQLSKPDLNEHLKEGGRGTAGTVRARKLTGGLLVVEIALALMLLVGAGLMMRSFLNLQQLNLGVETGNVLSSRVLLRADAYPEPADRMAFQERLTARLAALPVAGRFTVASNPPAGGAMNGPFTLERQEARGEDQPSTVARVAVVPGYFEALGVSMIAGREFNERDGHAGVEAVIVNEPFAARYWPGDNAVGKRMRVSGDADAPWLSVVGISPAIFQQGNNSETTVQPGVYVPYRQEPTATLSIIAFSPTPPAALAALAALLREEVRALDSDLPLFNVVTLDDAMRQRTWPYRVFGGLFAIFALIALVMAAVGIYGVTAYAVGQRTSEIGLRIALGASQRSVLWLVLRQGLLRVSLGLIIGLAGAWGVSRLLRSLLVGVTTTDPLTFVAIPLVLATVTIVACLVPARRAMRLDPSDALRA